MFGFFRPYLLCLYTRFVGSFHSDITHCLAPANIRPFRGICLLIPFTYFDYIYKWNVSFTFLHSSLCDCLFYLSFFPWWNDCLIIVRSAANDHVRRFVVCFGPRQKRHRNTIFNIWKSLLLHGARWASFDVFCVNVNHLNQRWLLLTTCLLFSFSSLVDSFSCLFFCFSIFSFIIHFIPFLIWVLFINHFHFLLSLGSCFLVCLWRAIECFSRIGNNCFGTWKANGNL